MKKIILLAAIAVCSISSYAQFAFGVQLGPNLELSKAKDDQYTSGIYNLENDPKVGFLIGVLAEVGFGKLAFRPELNFIQRGSKTGLAGYNQLKFNLNYVEVPLNVVYNLKLSKVGKVFFGLGPNVGIGLGGKIKYENGESTKVAFDGKKEPTHDDKAHFKRMDIGANIIAGFQLKMGVFAKLGFTYGFSNLYPDKNYPHYDNNGNYVGTYDQSYKNRSVNLTIGYMLGKK
ncbi:MAG: porin family protein [Ferruginibacter sp.]